MGDNVKTRGKWQTKLIVAVLILLFVGAVFSMTAYGLGYYERWIDRHTDHQWAPKLQFQIAKIHRIFERHKTAAASYKRYYELFPGVDLVRTVEAKYMEINSYHDARQFLTAYNLIEEFLKEYEGDSSAQTFYTSVSQKKALMSDSSKRIDEN